MHLYIGAEENADGSHVSGITEAAIVLRVSVLKAQGRCVAVLRYSFDGFDREVDVVELV